MAQGALCAGQRLVGMAEEEKRFHVFETITLTPMSGILFLLVMIFTGRAFRENWKAQAEGWSMRAWLYGVPATLSFLILALVPLHSV
jgi:hypothetical protein